VQTLLVHIFILKRYEQWTQESEMFISYLFIYFPFGHLSNWPDKFEQKNLHRLFIHRSECKKYILVIILFQYFYLFWGNLLRNLKNDFSGSFRNQDNLTSTITYPRSKLQKVYDQLTVRNFFCSSWIFWRRRYYYMSLQVQTIFWHAFIFTEFFISEIITEN
jgi:hypothetical protein